MTSGQVSSNISLNSTPSLPSADKYIFYNSPFIQVTPSTINEILVSIPSDRMQELARLTFQAGHNTSQPIQIDRMNEFLREDKSINS